MRAACSLGRGEHPQAGRARRWLSCCRPIVKSQNRKIPTRRLTRGARRTRIARMELRCRLGGFAVSATRLLCLAPALQPRGSRRQGVQRRQNTWPCSTHTDKIDLFSDQKRPRSPTIQRCRSLAASVSDPTGYVNGSARLQTGATGFSRLVLGAPHTAHRAVAHGRCSRSRGTRIRAPSARERVLANDANPRSTSATGGGRYVGGGRYGRLRSSSLMRSLTNGR